MSVRLDMIGLTVKDMAESIRFYRALGIEIPDPDGGPYHDVKLESGVRLSWNDVNMVREIDPSYMEPVGQRIGIAFLCDSPAAVDERYQAMLAAGFKGYREPWDAFWGHRYALLEDPDGNIVDLFAPQ